MTAYATRSPLQLLSVPHMMNDSRHSSRRTSARLADKESVPLAKGIDHTVDEVIRTTEKYGAGSKQAIPRTNGAVVNSVGGRVKRKHADFEEDDGFIFTRKQSKPAKGASTVQMQQPVLEELQEAAPRSDSLRRPRGRPKESSTIAPAEQEAKQPKKRRKQIESIIAVPAPQDIHEPRRRKSARLSGDSDLVEPLPLEGKKKRPKQNGGGTTVEIMESGPKAACAESGQNGGIEVPEGTSRLQTQQTDLSKDVTKIALPFADTPIIRRNKEMRKGGGDGSRRSSLGMRGRRASSLIDGGKSNALPHDEVESSEFYKHVESGLPEPRRMRQLLTWCGTRALPEKPSFAAEDSNAKLAAREIQQQLLKDFSTKSEMSDWFNREEATPHPQPPKPNPKNLANLAKIGELEQQIAKLQSERQTWESLLQPPTPSLLPLSLQSGLLTSTTISAPMLGSPTQTALLETLQSFEPLSTSVETRLQNLTRSLEFSVDIFAENVHVVEQYRQSAERVSGEVFRVGAEALEERERRGEERSGGPVGVREVLRGLSRIVER